MSIRAKMVCTVAEEDGCGNERLYLVPVVDDGGSNAQWSKWTPGGELHLSISNPDAKGQHVVGKEYYVDITPVE